MVVLSRTDLDEFRVSDLMKVLMAKEMFPLDRNYTGSSDLLKTGGSLAAIFFKANPFFSQADDLLRIPFNNSQYLATK